MSARKIQAAKPKVLPNTVGIEYTFVPALVGARVAMQLFAVVAAKALKASEGIPEKTKSQISYDGGAVEVRSPVFRTADAITDFSQMLFWEASQLCLVPRLVTTGRDGSERYYGTGGGHVHVGFPRDLSSAERKLFFRNVAVDSANRFYLNWFFQEWHDDDTLPDAMVDECRKKLLPLSGFAAAEYAKRERNAPIAIRARHRNRESWMRENHNTLEFRLFDAPRDTSMVLRNVDFAIAYTQYLKRLSQKGKVIPLKKREILNRAELTPDEVKRRLQRFFGKLDLDYGAYHETYWPNYEMRAEYGKL